MLFAQQICIAGPQLWSKKQLLFLLCLSLPGFVRRLVFLNGKLCYLTSSACLREESEDLQQSSEEEQFRGSPLQEARKLPNPRPAESLIRRGLESK